jgi:hypothetical protein
MGGGQSTIVNVEDVQDAINAGEINIQNTCKYVKCPPNKESFKNENNNNNIFLLVILIILIILLIYFILKKYI